MGQGSVMRHIICHMGRIDINRVFGSVINRWYEIESGLRKSWSSGGMIDFSGNIQGWDDSSILDFKRDRTSEELPL